MLWQCKNSYFDTRMPIVMGILSVEDVLADLSGDLQDLVTQSQSMAAEGKDAACAPSDLPIQLLINRAFEQRKQGALITGLNFSALIPGKDCAHELAISSVRALASQGFCVAVRVGDPCFLRELIYAGAAIWEGADLELVQQDADLAALVLESNLGLILPNRAVCFESKAYLGSEAAGDLVERSCQAFAHDMKVWEALGVMRARMVLNPLLQLNEDPEHVFSAADERLIIRNIPELLRLGQSLQVNLEESSFIRDWYTLSDNASYLQAFAGEVLLAAQSGVSVLAASDPESVVCAISDLKPLALIALQADMPLLAGEVSESDALEAQINLGVACLCQLPDGELVDVSPCVFEKTEDGAPLSTTLALVRTGVLPHELQKLLDAIPSTLNMGADPQTGRFALKLSLVDYQAYTCQDEELTLPNRVLLKSSGVAEALKVLRPNYQPFYPEDQK